MLGTTLDSFERYIQKLLYSPFGLQICILTTFIFFIAGFQPTYFFWKQQIFGEQLFFHEEQIFSISESGFIDNFAGVENAGLEEVVIKDSEGNLIKKVEPRKQKTSLDYIIKSGDTLLSISHKFGLNVSTLLWANDMTAKETIIPGQSIKIPPADGIYYIVELGDTLGEVAEIHGISVEDIQVFNTLDVKGNVQLGQTIFLPGAKKTYVDRSVEEIQNIAQSSQTIPSIASAPRAIQSIGIRFRKPTEGYISQGVRPGHTALDIANDMNTPIYAAQDGVVIESRDGWNYGYGKYVIIDHGNNIHTLYAHLNTRDVQVGQTVQKGEFLGGMGNTGNVRGPTGIHLHFEIRVNGRKVNPNNYF